jgi:tetratricopeptide (TPR) repeat protein
MIKTSARILFTVCLFTLSFASCDYLDNYERDIQKFTRAINVARNDLELAHGYDYRGRAYAEKARYSHFRKLVSPEQYSQLFVLAVKDHNKAIELNPKSADAYFGRGKSYYFRAAYVETPIGSAEIPAGSKASEYFDLAMADFTKATELDAGHYLAFDMKGLIDMANKNYDQSIVDFTEVMRIKPAYGQFRLADACCNRGSFYQRQEKYNEAIADYQKAIELHPSSDGCDCEPYNPLAWIYSQQGEYAKSWEIVKKAKRFRVGIDKDFIEKLKAEPHY